MGLDYALGRTRLDEVELHGVRSLKTGRFTITAVTIDGQLLMPTREFWEDLFKRYQLTSGWAAGKSYARRFEWLAMHNGSDLIPYRVLWDDSGNAWVAPSRRRKVRKATPETTQATRHSSERTSATQPVASAERHEFGVLRCGAEYEPGRSDSLTGEEIAGESRKTEPLSADAEPPTRWTARRRRTRRHSKHGWPATRQSRLSHFFRGGRS